MNDGRKRGVEMSGLGSGSVEGPGLRGRGKGYVVLCSGVQAER